MKQVICPSKKWGRVIITSDATQYTICSHRLTAKSLNQEEESLLIAQYSLLLQDQENISKFGEGKPWSTPAVYEFIHNEMKHWNSGNRFSVFSVYQTTTQKFMGYLHIKHALNEFAGIGKGHPHAAEIIYIIDHTFWGKGYGTEIATLGKKFIKHIIAESSPERNLKEIVATVHPANEGSKKILQKTLKHQEQQEFMKFGNQPRLLFFKPLKNVPGIEKSKNLTSKL